MKHLFTNFTKQHQACLILRVIFMLIPLMLLFSACTNTSITSKAVSDVHCSLDVDLVLPSPPCYDGNHLRIRLFNNGATAIDGVDIIIGKKSFSFMKPLKPATTSELHLNISDLPKNITIIPVYGFVRCGSKKIVVDTVTNCKKP